MTSSVKTRKEYNDIVLFLKGLGNEIVLDKHSKKRLKKKSEDFILLNELLYLKNADGSHRRVLCDEEIEIVELECKTFHQGHHLGMHKFEYECNRVYFKIPRDLIRKVVSECVVCSQSQPLKTKEQQVHITAESPLERLMIDLVDVSSYEAKNCGYKWILTIIDVFSKYCWAFPLKNKSGKDVKEKLEELFLVYTGPPKIIQCDNGKEFCNSYMNELADDFKIVFKHSRPRHPQANGQIERFNQTLTRYIQRHIFEEEILTGLKDEKNWLKFLNKVIYLYNTSWHSAVKTTPFQLFFRRSGVNTVAMDDTSNNEIDVSNKIVEDLNEVEIISKHSIDENYLARMDRHSLVHVSKYNYKVGDLVILALDFDNNVKTKKIKFSSFYSDPAKIIEILSSNRAKILIGTEEKVVLLSRLKPYNK